MDEMDNSEDRARRDLDATTPNIPFRRRQEGARASQPAAAARREQPMPDFDLTTPNIGLPADEQRNEQPAHTFAPARNNFDLTEMRIRGLDADEEEDAPAFAPAPEPHERQPFTPPGNTPRSAPQRRTAPWMLVAGAGAALLSIVIIVALFVLLPRGAAFTLKVLEAPPGSRVFVDGVPSGVPQADGTITVQGLKADAAREVSVRHEGYDEWSTSVKGEAGGETVVTAKLTPKAQATAAPADEIEYNGPMVFVAAGAFRMGDDSHRPDEKPEHEVSLPAYYIDKFEVTNAQYKKFCDETRRPYPPDPWWDTEYFNTQPQSPVVGVSWDDAAAYAAWAGKRLPKEEEWEKAASWGPGAQRKRRWPWGDAPEPNRASLGLKPQTLRLTAVGENAAGASAYGAQGMAGNAAEWVDAFYRPYEGNSVPNPEYGEKNRVVRGGTSVSTFDDARTTRRFARPPDYTAQERAANAYLIGFRCVVSADDPQLQEKLGAKNH